MEAPFKANIGCVILLTLSPIFSRRIAFIEKNLPLKIAPLHKVTVCDSKSAQAGPCQQLGLKASERSAPDDKNGALSQFSLTVWAYFGQNLLPGITIVIS